MKPQNRKELLLDAIANGKVPNFTPENRKEAFLKKIAEKAAAGGGGGTQPDWSQNDETAPDYVKNRTHYGDYYKCNKSFALPVQSEATVVTVEGFKYKLGDFIPWEYHLRYNGEMIKWGGGTTYITDVGKETYLFGYPQIEARGTLEETGESGVYNLVLKLTNKYSEEEKFIIDYEYDTLKRLDMKYLPEHLPYEAEEIVNEPLNITWDGNTDGLESFDTEWGFLLCRLSEVVLTDEDIKLGTITTNGQTVKVSDMWGDFMVTDDIVSFGELGVIVARKAPIDTGDIKIPKVGIWVADDSQPFSFATTVEHTKTVVHKLDMKYLPIDEIKTALGIDGK